MAVGLEDIRRQQQQRAHGEFRAFVEDQLGREWIAGIEVPLGVSHVELCRLARDRGIDLIVMATHGRGFVSHAIMGSTTERVLRRASCPVLVVRDDTGQGG